MKIGVTYTSLENETLSSMLNAEHDFTELSAISNLKKEINNLGYDVELYGDISKMISSINESQFNCDLIFNMAVGTGNRNRMGVVPMYLENRRIPFTGSDAYALQLSTNKMHMKYIAYGLGIPTPKSFFLSVNAPTIEIISALDKLNFPIIIKPNELANSLGMILVNNASEMIYHTNQIFKKYNQPVLLEEFIDGFDVMVPILGNNKAAIAKNCVQYLNSDKSIINIFDTKTKHNPDLLCIKADIDDGVKNKLIDYSLKIHKTIPFNDFSRMDFRVNKNNEIFFLESNALPDLNNEGAFSIAFDQSFRQIVNYIINEARNRYGL